MELRTLDDLLDALVAMAAQEQAPGIDGLSHGLQCAARLAEFAPGDLELQLAGLVHDIGTALDATDAPHAVIGADAVRPILGARVAGLVRAHTAALRYLLTTEAHYRGSVAPRSIDEVRAAGGLMDPTERTALEAHPDFRALLLLRRSDDLAFAPNRDVPGLAAWCPSLEQLVDARSERPTRRIDRIGAGA